MQKEQLVVIELIVSWTQCIYPIQSLSFSVELELGMQAIYILLIFYCWKYLYTANLDTSSILLRMVELGIPPIC